PTTREPRGSESVFCPRGPTPMPSASELLPGWRREPIAGHTAEIFEPPRPNEFGYTVIYLHGVHLKTLGDNAVYSDLFARHGLRVVVPLTGRSWWSDRICREFDPSVTAEQYVRGGVMPFIQERFGAAPPRIALLGTSMGGQGALRLSFKYP